MKSFKCGTFAHSSPDDFRRTVWWKAADAEDLSRKGSLSYASQSVLNRGAAIWIKLTEKVKRQMKFALAKKPHAWRVRGLDRDKSSADNQDDPFFGGDVAEARGPKRITCAKSTFTDRS